MPKRAILFPGQGAQSVGMGADLYEAYQSVRDLYDQADASVDFDLKEISFRGPEAELMRTDVSQPAIVVASLAALYALREEMNGAIPGVVACAGMSLGEYTALCFAGVLSLEDTLQLVVKRGQFMQQCCDQSPSGMVTPLGLGRDAVEAAIAEAEVGNEVGIANDNAPKQVVYSGTNEGLSKLEPVVKAKGARRVIALKVAGAYHSRIMVPAGEKLAAELEGVTLNEAKIPVFANIDAKLHDQLEQVKDKLVRQVSGTVCWRETMSQLVELGVEQTIELGPGGVLKGLTKKNARACAGFTAMSREQVQELAKELQND